MFAPVPPPSSLSTAAPAPAAQTRGRGRPGARNGGDHKRAHALRPEHGIAYVTHAGAAVAAHDLGWRRVFLRRPCAGCVLDQWMASCACASSARRKRTAPGSVCAEWTGSRVRRYVSSLAQSYALCPTPRLVRGDRGGAVVAAPAPAPCRAVPARARDTEPGRGPHPCHCRATLTCAARASAARAARRPTRAGPAMARRPSNLCPAAFFCKVAPVPPLPAPCNVKQDRHLMEATPNCLQCVLCTVIAG